MSRVRDSVGQFCQFHTPALGGGEGLLKCMSARYSMNGCHSSYFAGEEASSERSGCPKLHI